MRYQIIFVSYKEIMDKNAFLPMQTDAAATKDFVKWAGTQIFLSNISKVNLCDTLCQIFWSKEISRAIVHHRMIDIYCLIQSDIELPIVAGPLSAPKRAPKH